MQVTKPQVEQILKTLPIGYYCGRDVKVFLDDNDGSYYNMMTDEIHISYPMIEKVTKSLSENEIVENDIRCLLYHEVSHALLTNKELKITDVINIFEDERIETILANYYMNVDFKQFVKRMNNFHNELPTNADDFYYQIVRYRIGPKQFTDRVASLIEQYKRTSDCGYWYEYDIDDLYRDITNYFNQLTKQNKQPNQNSQNSQNSQNRQNGQNNQNSQTTTNNLTNEDIKSLQQQCCQQDAGQGIGKDEAKSFITANVSKFDDANFEAEITKILSNIKSNDTHNGSAINAYSGIFNLRSVARDDYKYFVQQNRIGHLKQFSKLHLNLFIDCSGSFSGNDIIVNKLLKILHKFERSNSNFSFDLISCGVGQVIRAKNDRIQHSYTGTCITSEIFEQYRKMQLSNYKNFNICLYDGLAVQQKIDGKNFSAFNNRDSVLIVDGSNAEYVNKYCKNAKVIITNSYTKELSKNILTVLKTFF